MERVKSTRGGRRLRGSAGGNRGIRRAPWRWRSICAGPTERCAYPPQGLARILASQVAWPSLDEWTGSPTPITLAAARRVAFLRCRTSGPGQTSPRHPPFALYRYDQARRALLHRSSPAIATFSTPPDVTVSELRPIGPFSGRPGAALRAELKQKQRNWFQPLRRTPVPQPARARTSPEPGTE